MHFASQSEQWLGLSLEFQPLHKRGKGLELQTRLGLCIVETQSGIPAAWQTVLRVLHFSASLVAVV